MAEKGDGGGLGFTVGFNLIFLETKHYIKQAVLVDNSINNIYKLHLVTNILKCFNLINITNHTFFIQPRLIKFGLS